MATQLQDQNNPTPNTRPKGWFIRSWPNWANFALLGFIITVFSILPLYIINPFLAFNPFLGLLSTLGTCLFLGGLLYKPARALSYKIRLISHRSFLIVYALVILLALIAPPLISEMRDSRALSKLYRTPVEVTLLLPADNAVVQSPVTFSATQKNEVEQTVPTYIIKRENGTKEILLGFDRPRGLTTQVSLLPGKYTVQAEATGYSLEGGPLKTSAIHTFTVVAP